jgi:hypothetical protein
MVSVICTHVLPDDIINEPVLPNVILQSLQVAAINSVHAKSHQKLIIDKQLTSTVNPNLSFSSTDLV